MTVEQLERLVEAVETVVDIVRESDGEVLSVHIPSKTTGGKPYVHLSEDAFAGLFGHVDAVPHSSDYDRRAIDARGIEVLSLKVKQ